MSEKTIKKQDPRDAIKKHIEENGIMQRFVAKKLGISDTHLCHILQKKRDLIDDHRIVLNEIWGTDY
jgi:predicted XRE-type DNA-binding protein